MSKLYQCDKCENLIDIPDNTKTKYFCNTAIILGLMYLWTIDKLGWWWLILFLF